MLPENKKGTTAEMTQGSGGVTIDDPAILERFALWVDVFGSLAPGKPALQARVLAAVKAIAPHLDASGALGLESGYDRQVIYEVPGRWTLAAIILRPGQETHPHDHGGWGCAVTVQGIERDRRFVRDAAGQLVLKSEREYLPGEGYTFDAPDIHQPFGADPRGVTVGLHFLAHEKHADETG